VKNENFQKRIYSKKLLFEEFDKLEITFSGNFEVIYLERKL